MCIYIYIYTHICVHAKPLQSSPTLVATLWTVAHQVPLSMGFSRQEYQSGLPCPPPGALSNPGIELTSLMPPALYADSLLLRHMGNVYVCVCAYIHIYTHIYIYRDIMQSWKEEILIFETTWMKLDGIMLHEISQ